MSTTVEAERAVLGSMMLSSRVVWNVIDVVEAVDFADQRHETIFRAIVALSHEGAPNDVIAVGERLARDGDITRVGGPAELHQMISGVSTASNASYHAEIVRRAAIRRRLGSVAITLSNMAQSTEGDVDELTERARAELDSVASSSKIEIRPISDSTAGVIDSMRDVPRFAPTPWADLNSMIGGYRPGALYVIGARPGAGKTIMGLQSALHLSKIGPVAYSSLEMDTGDLTRRLLSQIGGVHMSSISRNNLADHEWERIATARATVDAAPLFVDDRSDVSISQIRSFVRSVSRRGKLAAVVVDYLQLIASGDTRRPRWEVVGEFTRALKVLARELDVPVIVLAQLNRQSEGAGGARRLPSLADLRESGSIEQDADVVMLLQRSMQDDETPGDELEVIVAKNRHGQTGRATLFWEGHFARVSHYRF